MHLNNFKDRRVNFRRAIWTLFQDYIFRFVPSPLDGVRCSILRLFGAKIGKGVTIRSSVRVDSPENLIIGNHCWIGENVLLNNIGKITIGSNCCISQGCFLSSASHDYTKESFDLVGEPIVIRNGVWIGAGSMVHPGIEIGEESIIGAMSNVLKDVEPNTINFGNPCQLIRKR